MLKNNHIVVYSCVTKPYDNVENTLFNSSVKPKEDIKYVLFTDIFPAGEYIDGKNVKWEIRALVRKFPFFNRKTARWHKINSHLLFPDSAYTVWVDGNESINDISIEDDLINKYLDKNFIATFKHPVRSCIYDEADACIRLKKDKESIINSQMCLYRKIGYPCNLGLVETSLLIRKNCQEVTLFNNLWWDEMNKYSFRDQLSFNYVNWKLKMSYSIIPGHRQKSEFLTYSTHKKDRFIFFILNNIKRICFR